MLHQLFFIGKSGPGGPQWYKSRGEMNGALGTWLQHYRISHGLWAQHLYYNPFSTLLGGTKICLRKADRAMECWAAHPSECRCCPQPMGLAPGKNVEVIPAPHWPQGCNCPRKQGKTPSGTLPILFLLWHFAPIKSLRKTGLLKWSWGLKWSSYHCSHVHRASVLAQ